MMEKFKLQACDILVNINDRDDCLSRIKRWGIGPYDHVFLYMGQLGLYATPSQPLLKVPMLFESSGRGVVLQSLSNRYGQEVVVMRLKPEFRDRIPLIIEEAIKLASDPQAQYDYMCVPLNIVPRVFHDKFGMPLPLKYHRNVQMVCSEGCAEPCWRAKVPVLPEGVVPLPGDFVVSVILDEVNRGILSAEWV